MISALVCALAILASPLKFTAALVVAALVVAALAYDKQPPRV